MAPPRIAIVGRPNVGKSTLFNRMVGRRLALVDDQPGVTRDRREGEGRLGDLDVVITDTAGLDEADAASLEGRMRAQTEQAIADADLILFLVDARAGVTPADAHFADLVRRSGKPTILVANKSEGRDGLTRAMEAFALGLGDPVPVSAEHGEGLADLYAEVAEHVGDRDDVDDAEMPEDGPMRVAIVGRPNVGKSTLINRLVGEDRLLTGPEAGITRDSIAVDWQWRGRPFKLFDTAGLRRRSRVQGKIEKLSVGETLRAVRFAELVVLVIDATQPFEKQDLQIADLIIKEGRAVVIALNKWDRIDDPRQTLEVLREKADRLLPQIRGVDVVPVSAAAGKGFKPLMKAVETAHGLWNVRVPTPRLNRWFGDLVQRHPPPAVSGRRMKLRYITQAKTRPPTFVMFSSRPQGLGAAYRRYVVNGIREAFDLPGVPIRLIVRKTDNPYDKS